VALTVRDLIDPDPPQPGQQVLPSGSFLDKLIMNGWSVPR